MIKTFSAAILIIVLSFALIGSTVYAATDLNNSGNAAGSTNEVNVNQNSNTNVNQNNNTNINNNINAEANTGGNSGGDIKTGDAKVQIKVENKTGSNKTDSECCEPTKKPGPSVTPGGPTPTGKPGPTGTPGPNGGNGGPPGNGGNGGNGGGGNGNGAGQVMGIAAASNGSDKYFLYGAGLVCLGLGMYLAKQQRSLIK